jgi:hypothetical protein
MRTKLYSRLEKLWEKHGPHEFGKICQILLGFCLIQQNFRIPTFQLSGRPDIIAMKNDDIIAFEVKTQSGPDATIKPDDLDGVKGSKQSIIAVLSYPDLDCTWVLANANNIKAGKWPVSFLRQYSIVSLQKELNEAFPMILERYFTTAFLGTEVLHGEFNDAQKMRNRREIQ